MTRRIRGPRLIGALLLLFVLSGCAKKVIIIRKSQTRGTVAQRGQEQLIKQKFLALRIKLQQLRDAGLGKQADLLEQGLGPNPNAATINWAMAEASKLLANINNEPSYCRDPALSSHMQTLIVACVQFQECPDVTKAEQYFASEEQYRALIQKMPRSTVFFRAGKARLSGPQRAVLNGFVEEQVFKAKLGSYVFVIGRASKTGVYHKNLRFAADRAQAVVDYLEKESNVRLDVGHTAYSGYKMYITDADDLGENVNPRLTLGQLNQSATVFLYNCPSNVREWTRRGKGGR